jgi:hypothetical protein
MYPSRTQIVYPTPPASSDDGGGVVGFGTDGFFGIDRFGTLIEFVSFTTQAGSIV